MAKGYRKDTAPSLRNIYLTGFMCSGKTLAGRALAHALGRPFCDTDSLVKKASGLSPADLIKTRGLAAFRKAEADAVRELASEGGRISALGGGYYPSGRRASILRRSGITVFLFCRWEELEKRLKSARGPRPLLAGPWERARLRARKLYSARLPYYLRADITLDTTWLTPERTALKIADALKSAARAR